MGFSGGELIFLGEQQQVFSPKAGQPVFFSSGLENPHQVELLTSGQRHSLAAWFTCSERHVLAIFIWFCRSASS